MRVMYFLLGLILVSQVSVAAPFTGHIDYEVKYSKQYKGGPLPFEAKADLYVNGNFKLLVTIVAGTGKSIETVGFLFDDKANNLTTINYTKKFFRVLKYSMIPRMSIVEEKLLEKKNMKVLKYPVSMKKFHDIKRNLYYEAWYSDLRTSPIKVDKFDAAHIIDTDTGAIALLINREIAKGMIQTYKALNIDNNMKYKFEVPAGFTELGAKK